MLQQRQYNDVYGFLEVSNTAALSPGAVGNGTTVSVTAACTLQGTTSAATFGLGDSLEVIVPVSAASNGLLISATPTATAGTAQVYFQNQTGGSITPTAATSYKIIAKRFRADVV